MKMQNLISAFSVAAVLSVSPGLASADYPPIPDGLGKRVETPTLAPKAIVESAAIVTKPGVLSVVVEPKPSLQRITVRARDVDTGRVTTRTVTVRSGEDVSSVSLNLPSGTFRVQLTGQLKNGREVVWDAGRQTVRKKK